MKSRFSSSPSTTYLRQTFVEGMGGKQRSHDKISPVVIPQDISILEPTPTVTPTPTPTPTATATPEPTATPTPTPTAEPIKVIPTQNVAEKPIRTSNFKSKL